MTAKGMAPLLTLILAAGCGDPAGDGPYGPTEGSPVDVEGFTFCDVQTRIFEDQFSGCQACHSEAAAPASAGLNLETGVYANLVGHASGPFPALTLVVPGDADASYLVAKLEGTQVAAGGGGSRMPIGSTVSDDLMAGLRAWIDAGASESCEGFTTPSPTPTATASAVPTPTKTPDPDATPTAIPTPTQPDTPYTFTQVQAVFNANCISCHSGEGVASSGNLDLSASAHSRIVNVASGQATSLDLVEPGDATQSYMWHKLDGTHLTVTGGTGASMPFGSRLASQDDLDGIRAWINSGAPND